MNSTAKIRIILNTYKLFRSFLIRINIVYTLINSQIGLRYSAGLHNLS